MTFDILSFWKGNEFRYPEVAAMARDILSIHISIVALESTFSIGLISIGVHSSLILLRHWFALEIGYMESKVILVICIFNFFIYLYFFILL
jgi:hypothetical protein